MKWFIATTLTLLASAAGFAQAKPNIIMVLVDDVGFADLGCQGAKDIRTPNIDRLAKEGVRFAQFYSNAPVCTPTRAGFITGRYQQRVGLEWALGFTAEQFRHTKDGWVPESDKLALGLPNTVVTLPKLLKSLGYVTAAFGKWHLGYRPEFNPTRHGFDEYFGVLLGHADFYRYNYFDGTHCLFEKDQPAQAKGYLTDLLNQRAVEFIDRNAKGPFFLYLPHLACHFPFQSPDNPEQKLTKENHEQGSRALYGSMLERVDKGVGMILDTLDKNKIADNTLVVFSSDNGGYKYSDNSPFFHHKSTLWEGGVHVPCLMRWPARLKEGQVAQQVGITMDLSATFVAAAGGSAPQFDGIDLLPILIGEKAAVDRTLFWRIDRSDRKQKACRHASWKYIRDGWLDLLFDLKDDPGERRNIAFKHPERVAEIKAKLTAWEADVDRVPPAFRVK